MLLQNRDMTIKVPHTSTCIIKTKRELIQNGEIIEVVSPIFSSVDFQSGSIMTTETFQVPIHILTKERTIENPNGDCKATLVCDDNDIFHMYVRVQ